MAIGRHFQFRFDRSHGQRCLPSQCIFVQWIFHTIFEVTFPWTHEIHSEGLQKSLIVMIINLTILSSLSKQSLIVVNMILDPFCETNAAMEWSQCFRRTTLSELGLGQSLNRRAFEKRRRWNSISHPETRQSLLPLSSQTFSECIKPEKALSESQSGEAFIH
jgi:hypothetical protein